MTRIKASVAGEHESPHRGELALAREVRESRDYFRRLRKFAPAVHCATRRGRKLSAVHYELVQIPVAALFGEQRAQPDRRAAVLADKGKRLARISAAVRGKTQARKGYERVFRRLFYGGI